jgi:hypothetical protein
LPGVDRQTWGVISAFDEGRPLLHAAAIDWPIVLPRVLQARPDAGDWVSDQRRRHAAGAAETDPEPRWRIVLASDVEEAEPVRWLVNALIPAGELVMIVGDGETFKTTVALATAAHLPLGAPLFGSPTWTTIEGDVLIVTGEDSAPLLRNRLEAVCAGHGFDAAAVLSRIHILDVVGDEFSIDNPECRGFLLDAIAEIQPVLILFDPYADLTSAPENDNDQAKPGVKFFRACAATGAAVLVSHHLGKMSDGKRKIDRVRGASRLVHASRAVLFMERTELGVSVEVLKFNRGMRPDPFVLEHEIHADPFNPGRWTSACFRLLTQRQALANTSDQFVEEQLTEHGRLNTSELKEIAKTVPGVSGADVSAALKRLAGVGRIDHEPGPRGSKFWYLLTLPENSRQGGQGTLPTLPNVAGQGRAAVSDLALPFREGKVTEQPASVDAIHELLEVGDG